MYSLDLLGGAKLTGPGGPVPGHPAQKRQLALLALLATAGPGGAGRDKLQALLWPESPSATARHSLADTVYRLRKALGDACIQGDRDLLRLNPAILHADVWTFETLLDRGKLDEAVEHYRGPFLDGFHLKGSGEFEDWRSTQALRLGHRYEEALEALAGTAEEMGDSRKAAGYWRRLSTHDPLNTRFALGRMKALAAAGDPGNAVQAGVEHARILKEELGTEAPPELAALLQGLKTPDPGREEMGPSPGLGTPARVFPFDREGQPPRATLFPPFVGCEAELAHLRGLLDRALEGDGRVVFVNGEAGTGKTALATEFGRRALEAHPDLVAVRGNGNAHTGAGDPYLPFREILALLTGDVEARYAAGSLPRDLAHRLWSLIPVSVGALADVGPDLLDTFLHRSRVHARVAAFRKHNPGPAGPWPFLPRDPPGHASPPQQPALFLQFVRSLQAVARVRPLLLVLDDLQWADGGSLDLLFQLGRQLTGSRILVLGLYRPSEVAQGREGRRHPLEAVVNELRRTFGDSGVELGEGGDRTLVDALVDAEPNVLGEDFRRKLFEQTRGHALFTVELLAALREQGALVRDADGRWREGPKVRWDLMPARVEAVIAERIGRLPRPLQRALEVASAEGEWFCLEAVAAALGVEVHDLLATVSQDVERVHRLARMHGVQRLDRGHRTTCRFGHILFQRYLYGRMGETERIDVHRRLGEALETLCGEEKGDLSLQLQLARHFREAGEVERAVQYLVLASEESRRRSAYRESKTLLSEALHLTRTRAESTARDRQEMDVVSRLSKMGWVIGLYDAETEAHLVRFKELAEKLQDRDSRFWLGACDAIRHHYLDEQENTKRDLDGIEAIAESTGDLSQFVCLHVARALNTLNLGRPREVLTHLEAAEGLYDPNRDRRLLLQWLPDIPPLCKAMRALAVAPLGYPETAEALSAEAHALLTPETDYPAKLTVWAWDLCLRWLLVDVEAARGVEGPFRAVAREYGESGYLAMCEFSRGWRMAEREDPGRGSQIMRSAVQAMADLGWAVWRPFFQNLLADGLTKAGRAGEALGLMDESLEWIEARGGRQHEPEVHRVRGEAFLSLREPDPLAAEAAFRKAISVAQGQEVKLFQLRAATSLARLLRARGRAEEARTLLREIYNWFTEGLDTAADLKEAAALLAELEDAG